MSRKMLDYIIYIYRFMFDNENIFVNFYDGIICFKLYFYRNKV